MRLFTEEDNRIMANLDQVYEALKEVNATKLNMPRYMTWKTVSDTKYLYQDSPTGEKSLGKESEKTISIFNTFTQRKNELALRSASMEKRLNSIAAQYRALKLPMTMKLPAKILQEMDVRGLLGNQFLVVGSFGFSAYEMEAGCRFMEGVEETEDFDISWLTSPPAYLPLSAAPTIEKNALFDIIQLADKSFEVSTFSTHKLVNKDAFEIDVLCSQGDHFKVEVAEKNNIFGGRLVPLEMEGQEILHFGNPLRHIAVARGGGVSPLVVPDPRCMALHKFWLSNQRDRAAKKKNKDQIQASLLWQQCQDGNMLAYPIDEEFLSSIPEKWQQISEKLSSN